MLAGCIQFRPTEKVPAAEEVTPTKESNVSVTIDFPKTSFSVKEWVKGKYTVKNTGPSFKAYIVESGKKEGYEKEYRARVVTEIGSGMGFSSSLGACEITETSSTCMLHYFISPGTYVYEIRVYDCSEIVKVFGECSTDVEPKKVIAAISPLANVSKKVIVIGEPLTPQCERDEDCTQPCENCRRGTYVCYKAAKQCVECFISLDCKSGYECEREKCVPE